MKKIFKISTYIAGAMFLLLMASCTDENEIRPKEEGVLLNLGVQFGATTRLAELPNTGAMTDSIINGTNYHLNNVGVYVYYADDYAKGDLSKPYVRNRHFTVNNGELVAVVGSGADDSDKYIYVYDKMTVVAFYPYNAEMSKPENFFKLKADEEKYVIARSDYSEQFYIPYRAQTNVDPTNAYYTILSFQPKHTYKVEIIVVAKNGNALPNSGGVTVLPGIDPLTTADPAVDGKREMWFDRVTPKTNDGTGSDLQQYVAYIWTRSSDQNNIKRGDVLLKSDKLTLIASQDLYPNESNIYRYGYNMSTGEIFIPTSSNLVYDASSLQGINGGSGSFYQVCDIDLSTQSNWNPISIYGARYDGGGHKISNMTITAATSGQVGLFGTVQGNSVVTNVNLVDPTITVNKNNVFVGALVGRLNTPMTEAEKQTLIGNLPAGLSPIVREALIKEILASAGNSQANIVASKVQNPVITVTGVNPIVGAMVGQAGEKNDAGDSKSRIWDSAVLGGSITVNNGAPANNTNAYVGGFIGLNQGYVARTYTTLGSIDAKINNGVDENNVPILVDKFAGFATMGTQYTPAEGGLIESSFSVLNDTNGGVAKLPGNWPAWGTYTGIWPVETTGWLGAPSTSFWYSNGSATTPAYPTLIWERK